MRKYNGKNDSFRPRDAWQHDTWPGFGHALASAKTGSNARTRAWMHMQASLAKQMSSAMSPLSLTAPRTRYPHFTKT